MLLEQVLVDQRLEAVERRVADRLGRLQRAAAGEDGQARQQLARVLVEQLVAPVDRAAGVRWCEGRSRAPPVRSASRCPSRFSIACGVRRRTRAAASSIARAAARRGARRSPRSRPRSRRTLESGRTARARSRNRATDSYRERLATSGSRSGSGSDNGGTGYSCSAVSRSAGPAGDKELHAWGRNEQIAQRRCRLEQVLEVVEHEQRLLVVQELGQHVCERLRAGFGDAEGLRHRRQHELSVRYPDEPDHENAVGELLDQLRAGLEREPRLPRPGGPGQRDQPHLLLAHQARDRRELVLAPDQRRRLNGQVRRPTLQRSQRRERRRHALGDKLVQPLRLREILEPVQAEVTDLELLTDELPCGLREEHLPAVAGGADAGAAGDVETDVARLGDPRLAGVDADPNPERVCSEGPLHVHGRRDRVARTREGGEERLPLRVDLASTVAVELLRTIRWWSARAAS